MNRIEWTCILSPQMETYFKQLICKCALVTDLKQATSNTMNL